MWKESWIYYAQGSINIKKQIGHMKRTLIDLKKSVYIYKKLGTLIWKESNNHRIPHHDVKGQNDDERKI